MNSEQICGYSISLFHVWKMAAATTCIAAANDYFHFRLTDVLFSQIIVKNLPELNADIFKYKPRDFQFTLL